jgi:hypothetical protein
MITRTGHNLYGYDENVLISSDNMYVHINGTAGSEGSNEGSSSNYHFRYLWDAGNHTLTIVFDDVNSSTYAGNCNFIFSGCLFDGYNKDNIIVTVNEDIAYNPRWVGDRKFLTDDIYIRASNVVDLEIPTDEHINALITAKLNEIPYANSETEGF